MYGPTLEAKFSALTTEPLAQHNRSKKLFEKLKIDPCFALKTPKLIRKWYTLSHTLSLLATMIHILLILNIRTQELQTPSLIN